MLETSKRRRRDGTATNRSESEFESASSDRSRYRQRRRRHWATQSVRRGPPHHGREPSTRSRSPPVEDDADGHLIFSEGDLIAGRYKILSALGEGTFGKVVKVKDMQRNEVLALKVVRNVERYTEAAEMEARVLRKLGKWDPRGKHLCVQMLDYFNYHGHACLAFDMLGASLFDFLKDNGYAPYPMRHVREIALDLCRAVAFLHDNRLVHTDLKLENVLFYDSGHDLVVDAATGRETKVLRNAEIRVIDFGSATFEYEHHTRIVQTRHYRAPEVILELGWSYPCDAWSVGCILFEMALGRPLFDERDNGRHLAEMEVTLGRLPESMIRQSRVGKKYFSKSGSATDRPKLRPTCKPLIRYPDWREMAAGQEMDDWEDLMDLVSKLLAFRPFCRLTMREALRHAFFAPLKNMARSGTSSQWRDSKSSSSVTSR